MEIVWKITRLECMPEAVEHTNVVVTAHWECVGTDGTYSDRAYSTCTFPMPEGTFIPYDMLTEADVLGWCWSSGLNKDKVEATVAQKIADQKNPPIVSPQLPWATQS